MDLISEMLRRLSVKCNVTGLLSLRGDWAFESPKDEHAVFHVIFRGSVFVTFDNETIKLDAGDMIMFTRGHAHLLSSAPGATKVNFAENDTRVRMHAVADGDICEVVKDNDGPETSIVCARFKFGASGNDLVRHFPDCAVVTGIGDETSVWLEPVLRRIATESQLEQPGALAELDGLMNVIYLQFMRHWLRRSPPVSEGWLNGSRDPNIGRALHLMHENPARNWSVQELAGEVGMSRSNFSARFANLVGEPPLRYLTSWRLALAAQDLQIDALRPIGDIAATIGYESEASFSAAFKRQFGQPPGAWRRSNMRATTNSLKNPCNPQ